MTAPPEQLPDQNKILIMAYGWIHAWLAEDYWTTGRIRAQLEASGANPGQVAECFSLAAAALLSEAFEGNKLKAMALAARKYSDRVGKTARNRPALSRTCALGCFRGQPRLTTATRSQARKISVVQASGSMSASGIPACQPPEASGSGSACAWDCRTA
jgi:hypothetical protein